MICCNTEWNVSFEAADEGVEEEEEAEEAEAETEGFKFLRLRISESSNPTAHSSRLPELR